MGQDMVALWATEASSLVAGEPGGDKGEKEKAGQGGGEHASERLGVPLYVQGPQA